ncbi:TIGR00153 family protein [Arenicella chitinivorans]|uniref:TIGR00153 family protein n=1 Tax=Arenicella chitinivorans TaxID=1329800 RepID=A0A918RUE5_9GAMM|nr:TIGR00153 family protein [Arenicella chitinivorans]GHA13139.1 TIGR00153 family protein [Arenicella chitinivorans]
MVGSPFTNLFGQSPIRPIQEHIGHAHQCAVLLQPFVEAAIKNDWDSANALYKQISDLEHKADEAKTKLRANLPSSLMMPVDRGDLLLMVSKQDKIANHTKDIAGIMVGRQMQIPLEISESMRKFVEIAIETSAQAVKAVNEMDELLELGFKGRVLEVVEKLIEELNRLEHENDELQIQVRSELFQIEDSLSPVNVVFLYKVIEGIGALADAAQSAGGKLQLLIAR